MLFNSFAYMAFLPLLILIYYFTPHRFRWGVLLVASYYFYMSWNPELVVLIAFTTLTSYTSALLIEKCSSKTGKNVFLILGILISVSFLFYFKYFNFFGEALTLLLNKLAIPMQFTTVKLILPVGISFYTFQTLSYIIDVYKGDIKAEKHIGIYALYVSFSPQLVAGPIERAKSLLPQFYTVKKFSTIQATQGLQKILFGLFKKIVIADFLAVYVNNVYNNIGTLNPGGITIIVATFLFTIQIYCDFSGYSDIAIGSAKILGFDLMENFKSPYLSLSIKEFWRRWHISLSSWFSDYVYIPLGGSRVPRYRYLLNLLITFVLSGLWHGASFNFVLWGLYHGILLVFQSLLSRPLDNLKNLASKSLFTKRLYTLTCWGVTLSLVSFGLMIFRANNLSDLSYLLKNLKNGLNPLNLFTYLDVMNISPSTFAVITFLIVFLFICDFIGRDKSFFSYLSTARPYLRYSFYYFVAICVVFSILTKPDNIAIDFIYFQF